MGTNNNRWSATWTDEDINTLRTEWSAGKTGSQIAALINKTRNSVIGKAHRLKLEARGNVGNRQAPNAELRAKRIREKKEKSAALVVNKKAIAPQFYAAATPLGSKEPISIMELGTNTCRAVVGHGPDGLAVYCGDVTFPEKSWCPGHCAIYLTPREGSRRYR